MSARIQVQGLTEAHMAYLDAHPNGRAAAVREAIDTAISVKRAMSSEEAQEAAARLAELVRLAI